MTNSPDDAPTPPWLEWAREMQAMAQTGLTYAKSHYDEILFRRFMEIAAEMTAMHGRLEPAAVEQVFLCQPGYSTVKVDVRGAVIREGRVLLVQERLDEKWCLPGGWADVGEYPSAMVEREIQEESGVDARAARLVGLYDANRKGRPLEFFHAYKAVFLCKDLGGEPRPSEETMDAAFFDFDDLPVLSENRTDARHLAEIRRHLADPCRPAAFE
ncbi:NUDIX hydrolase [Oceanidesulfovibrio indonesiensis]|uniref:NUDIX hydrolase n=1 Tax=Oceanidesulfovibrio indonesiensis TaxID=54767 RepID=A0A7M3MDB9_9BACT|nr:NUDIX hydrolase N-terminal domain-containing protein [Oceanidesulfovibrio indonesiensis]TVM15999.1 NUDIX hydrolase [Oceanidesulfovibrio indonesiensis]